MIRRLIGVCLLGVTAAALTGCAGGDKQNRQAVSGTVSFKGQPVKMGQVEFHPAGGQETKSGAPIENGSFAIPAEQGLTPGNYRVIIRAPDRIIESRGAPGSDTGPPSKELLPARYNEQSTLTREVKDARKGGDNKLDFDLN
jgi:hypothetical protein